MHSNHITTHESNKMKSKYAVMRLTWKYFSRSTINVIYYVLHIEEDSVHSVTVILSRCLLLTLGTLFFDLGSWYPCNPYHMDKIGEAEMPLQPSGSGRMHRQWIIPAGWRSQNLSIGILQSLPVSTIPSTVDCSHKMRCIRSSVHAVAWIIATASNAPSGLLGQLLSVLGAAARLVSRLPLASLRPYAWETTLTWHWRMNNLQAVRPRIQ